MLSNLTDQIADGVVSNIIFTLIGAFILYVIQRIYQKNRELSLRRKIRRELVNYKRHQNNIDVVDLANGDPEFEKQYIFVRDNSIFGRHRHLYIGFPEDAKNKLHTMQRSYGYSESELSKFHQDTSLDGSHTFHDLECTTGIPELSELINKHRHLVADKFISGTDGAIFNGNKFGIYDLRFTRFGAYESPGVEIDLFGTDYFTHRVFRSIYHELKNSGHSIRFANIDTFRKYRPFYTSFGINTLVICNGSKGKEIVLSRRSTRVHGARSKFHITMNEGLSQTDKDPFGQVDLELCFKRGLLEELGIDNRLYALGNKACFYDFFLDRSNLEIGLSSVFEINMDFDLHIRELVARDKQLESDDFQLIPLRTSDIDSFVEDHEFVPHGLYVLNRVLLRENEVRAGITTHSSGRAVRR